MSTEKPANRASRAKKAGSCHKDTKTQRIYDCRFAIFDFSIGIRQSKIINLFVPSRLNRQSATGRLSDSLWLADRSSERGHPSAILARVFHLDDHRRAHVPGIAGCRAAVSARIDLFGLGGRTQVRARSGDLPTCRTGINRRRLGFLLFRGLGHKKSPYRLPCFLTAQSVHTIKAGICSPKPAARRAVRIAAKARPGHPALTSSQAVWNREIPAAQKARSADRDQDPEQERRLSGKSWKKSPETRFYVCFAGSLPEKYVVTTIDYSGEEALNKGGFIVHDNRGPCLYTSRFNSGLPTLSIIGRARFFVQSIRSPTDLVQAEGVFPANAGTETRRMAVGKTGLRLGGRPGDRLGLAGSPAQ